MPTQFIVGVPVYGGVGYLLFERPKGAFPRFLFRIVANREMVWYNFRDGETEGENILPFPKKQLSDTKGRRA